MMILLKVGGTPHPKPRVKVSARGGFAKAYYPDPHKFMRNWRAAIRNAALMDKPKEPLSGPVKCDMIFYMPRPKSHYRTGKYANQLRADAPFWHTAGGVAMGGDRDNLDKAVLDVLTECGYWHDDGQVCDGRVKKIYATNHRTGAIITIQTLDQRGSGELWDLAEDGHDGAVR